MELKKYCSSCNTVKNLMAKPYAKSKKTGYFLCRNCHTERLKKYRATVRGKERQYAANMTSNKRDMGKYRARQAVSKALQSGQLQRPEYCSSCLSEQRVYAHHKSYDKNKWLDVMWLCRPCHATVHRELKNK